MYCNAGQPIYMMFCKIEDQKNEPFTSNKYDVYVIQYKDSNFKVANALLESY